MRLDFLCTYTVEDLEFLDTFVHIHVYKVTMHEYKTIVMGISNHWNGIRTGLDWNGMEQYGIAK